LPHLAREHQFVKMFLDEARIAARLNHPNIAEIYNLGAQGGTYFLAMELVDGRDLRELWRMFELKGHPMQPQYACYIVAQAARALHYAHNQTNRQGQPLGIVHRDVSPQNILVSHSGRVKVVDFGIAKANDSSSHTRAGVLKGKFAYMAPEQAAGGKVDRRVDIFALGVVLHELLLGKRLYNRDTDVSTLTAVGHCFVDPPSDWAEGVDDALDAIVLKVLAKNPLDRYASGDELMQALERWLNDNGHKMTPPALASYVSSIAKELDRSSERRKKVAASRVKPLSAEKHRSHEELVPEVEAHREAPPPKDGAPSPPTPLAPPVPDPVKHKTVTMPAQPSLVGKAQAPNQWAAVFASLFGVTLLALLLVLAFQFLPKSGAVMRVTSEPPGASVFWNGEPLSEKTPCRLPTAQSGAYWLEVNLSGYEAYRSRVDVPQSGERELTVVLKPLH
jgi:serine/threonine protein kinase